MTADVGQALAGLQGVSSAMTKAGASMTSTGRTLTRGVTVPVGLAAAASTKMALDYERAFTRISALSNTSAANVARWKEEVKGLAEATGRDPIELADALFYLSSAGLKTDQVMLALEASAQASAVGLGDMTDVAKLTANVLNAYRKSGITAAQATDTLVAAVKAGTAEPEEFAGAIGRILPIASKAKVGFDQVVASLAALSNIGLDVNEGVTAMRGLLQALIAPTDMAREAMKKIGLSAQDLLDAFQEDGILGAMTLLEERTAKVSDSEAEMFDIMRRVVPNIRALTGELALTGENAGQVEKIFRQVIGTTGDLGEAMKKTQQDAAFQLEQQLAKLKVAAIDAGNAIIPILKDVVEVIADVAKSFSELSPETRESIVKWALFAAAVGPALRILGAFVTAGGKVIGVLAGMGRGIAALATGQGISGALSAMFGGAGAGAAGKATSSVSGLSGALGGLLARFAPLGLAIGAAVITIRDLATEAQPAADDVQKIATELLATGESATGAALNMKAWEAETAAASSTIGSLLDSLKANPVLGFWGDSAQEAGEKASNAFKLAHQEISSRLIAQIDLAKQQGGGFDEATGAVVRTLIAQKKYAEALDILNRGIAHSREAFMRQMDGVIKAKDAFEAWAPVLQRSTELTDRQRLRIGGLVQAVAAAGGTIKGLARDQLQAAIATGDFGDATRILSNALDGLPGSKKVKVEIPGIGTVIVQVGHLLDAINALPARKTIAINIAKEQGMGPPSSVVPGGQAKHGGGFIQGVGDVPILGKAGEFVWAEEAVKNFGPAKLARVHEYFKRMHAGGPVGHHAAAGGGGGGSLGSLIGDADALAKQLEQLTQHLKELGDNAEKAREATEKARSRVERELERTLTQIGSRFEKMLAGFSSAFDDLESQIEDLASTIEGFQEGVKSGITSFASLTNLKGTPTGTDPGATLMAFLQGQLGQAQEFSSLIQELQAAGLSPDLVAQMAAAGPEMLTILQAIKQAGVGNVNAVWNQITALAQSTAEALSGPLFGKQVDDLNKALAALEKDFKELSKTFEELPKRVKKDFLEEVATLGKGLGNLARILKSIPGMQHGGTVPHSGGMYRVGEAGEEIVRLPGGAQVYPHGTAPAAAGGPVTVVMEGAVITGTIDVDTGRLEGRIVRGVARVHEDIHYRAKQRKTTL